MAMTTCSSENYQDSSIICCAILQATIIEDGGLAYTNDGHFGHGSSEGDCDDGYQWIPMLHGADPENAIRHCCISHDVTSITLQEAYGELFTDTGEGIPPEWLGIDSLTFMDFGNQDFTNLYLSTASARLYGTLLSYAQTPGNTLKYCNAFNGDLSSNDLLPCNTYAMSQYCTGAAESYNCSGYPSCTDGDFCTGFPVDTPCGDGSYCDTTDMNDCGGLDQCGECDGPGTNCADCFGTSPTGWGRPDGYNNCINCEGQGVGQYEDCTGHPDWGQSAVGCFQATACNYNMSSLTALDLSSLEYSCIEQGANGCSRYGYNVSDIGYTNHNNNTTGINPIWFNESIAEAGTNCYYDVESIGENSFESAPADEYCSTNFIDGGNLCNSSACQGNDVSTCIFAGETDINGGMFYLGNTCNCYGEPTGQDENLQPYCGCNGEVQDVNGVCGGTCDFFAENEGDAPWDTIPLLYSCEDWGGECQPSGTVRFSETAHPDGLYSLGGDYIYCDCNGTEREYVACYPTESDQFSEQAIYIAMCTEFQTCEDFSPTNGFYYTNNPDDPAALDQGCMDPTACNYNEGYDIDCAGNPSNTDTSCCVFPSMYCSADGLEYHVEGEAGEEFLCDVDINGNVLEFVELCPVCNLAEGIDYHQDQCHGFNYDYENYNGTKVRYDQLSSAYCDGDERCTGHLINAGHPTWSDPNGWVDSGVGYYDTPPDYMLDTCDISFGCGINQDQDVPVPWETTGCNDPASLGYGIESSPLYWTDPDTYLATLHNQGSPSNPMEMCKYCPPGYSFIWNVHYGNGSHGISTEAQVTAENWPANEYSSHFHLSAISNVLQPGTSDYDTGACFSDTDLQVLSDLSTTVQSYGDNPFYVVGKNSLSQAGVTHWDAYGKISWLKGGGETLCGPNNSSQDPNSCRSSLVGLGSTGTLENPTEIPTSIQNLTNLTYLDFSFQKFGGHVIPELGKLQNCSNMNLSYNYFNRLNVDKETGHQYYRITGDYYGLCELVGIYGTPTTQNQWLKLWGNRICPYADDLNLNNITSYPNCLSPSKAFVGEYMEPVGAGNLGLQNPIQVNWNVFDDYSTWEDWVYDHLGFIETPTYSSYNLDGYSDAYGWVSQNIVGEDGLMDCPITGCTDPEALNYWPEAGNQCTDNECCIYDKFLHFPWHDGCTPEGTMCEGSYGGDLTLLEMVAALHSNQCGYQYNSFGDLDVTGNFSSATPQEMCDYTQDYFFNTYGYIPLEVVKNCNFTFQNTSIDGNLTIDWWDGIYIRSGYDAYSGNPGSGEIGAQTDLCHTRNDLNETVLFDGDSRPLEFISRVMAYQQSLSTAYGMYINGYFPAGGSNISMVGIQYFEDFKMDPATMESDVFTSDDWEEWIKKGRIDIAYYIQGVMEGWYPYPDPRPIDYELWEQAPVAVSMSYSQKFISEVDAGFTLYSEPNSPGLLQRSGQWQCDDGGSADICYSNLDACGRVPYWIEECVPCGNGNGECVPLTLDTAAEGHHKITKTKTLTIPYFSNGQSTSILGSNIYTASLSSSNDYFYYNVMDGDPNSAGSNVQFSVSWGHYAGSGSAGSGSYNAERWKGASETVYKTYASMLLDDSEVDKGFFITSGSDVNGGTKGNKDEWIYILNLKRNNFEDSIQPGTWTLALSSSTHQHTANTSDIRYLTDNSNLLTSPAVITDAGRRFDIISGSAGQVTDASGYVPNNLGRYGFFYPDAGLMVFGEKLSNDLRGVLHGDSPVTFKGTSTHENQLFPYTGSTAGDRATAIDAIDADGAGANDSEFTINVPTVNGGEGVATSIIVTGSAEPEGETTNKIAIGVSGLSDSATAALIIKAINGTADNNIQFAPNGAGTAGIPGIYAYEGSTNEKITLAMDTPGTVGNVSSVLADGSGVDVVDVTAFTGGVDPEAKNALRFINCMRNLGTGLGFERNDITANATSPGNEADGTSGWTNGSGGGAFATFASVGGSYVTRGSKALRALANATLDYGYFTMSNLIVGRTYNISWDCAITNHSATKSGSFKIGTSNDPTNANNFVNGAVGSWVTNPVQTTAPYSTTFEATNATTYFTVHTLGSDTEFYIDNLSVKETWDANALTISGEKEVSEVVYVCVLNNESFNFTSNFSIMSGSGRTMVGSDTGVMGDFSTALTSSAFLTETQIGDGWETSTAVSGSNPIETRTTIEDEETSFIWPGSRVPTMHGNPTTFVTGVQLYDEHGEMLAIAQLSKPIRKDFGKEVIIKVKLTY